MIKSIIITIAASSLVFDILSQEKYVVPSVVNFLGKQWTHMNDGKGVSSIERFEGEEVFAMTRTINDSQSANVAIFNDLSFTNGVIACDIYSPVTSGELSFLGLVFRARDPTQYECVYFRPFVSGKIGAVQYLPVFNKTVEWPHYVAEAYKAVASIPEQQWFHIRVEVEGPTLRVYIDNHDKPKMIINTLAFGSRRGKVGFWLGNSQKALFKNLQITQLD